MSNRGARLIQKQFHINVLNDLWARWGIKELTFLSWRPFSALFNVFQNCLYNSCLSLDHLPFFPDVTQWFASAFYSLQCKRGATSPLQQAANENKK